MKRLRTLLIPLYWYLIVAIIETLINTIGNTIFASVLSDDFSIRDNLSMMFGLVLGTLSCFASLLFPLRRRPSPKAGLAHLRSIQVAGPLLLGLVFALHLGGQVITFLLNVGGIVPRVSWSDAFVLGEYPLLLFIIFLLPTRRLSHLALVRVVLDSLMIMTAILIFIWYFLLEPIMLQSQGTLFEKLVAMAYPFSGLVLLCCFIFLSSRSSNVELRPTKAILLLVLLLLIIGDSAAVYGAWRGSPIANNIQNITWSVGYALLSLTAFFMRFVGVEQQKARESMSEDTSTRVMPIDTPSLWLSLLPYLLIPAVVILMFVASRSGKQGIQEEGIYIGGGVLLVQILLRQVFALRETTTYARQLHSANADLESLATTDPLTALPNHRALVSILNQELERAVRYGHSCALLFLDLDHFKALNDGYGHAAGDTALREFSSVISATIRGTDRVGRWGGEEFIVLLPETNAEEALLLAERVRSVISKHTFTISGGLHLTCSIGMACYPQHAQSHETLVSAADQAMYGAKRLGRNQVRAANDEAILALLHEAEAQGGREETALVGTVGALAALVEARDPFTGHHSQRVADLVLKLAVVLGLPAAEAQMLALAGQLHDIGKIAIPDAILQKAGSLTEDEWKVMCEHPVVGAEVIGRVPSLRPLAPTVRAHHERWDGYGYPDNLAEEAIPLGARIIAVADAYIAMITDLPYAPAMPFQAARLELQRSASKQLDPRVVTALIELLEREQSMLMAEMAV